LDYFRERMLRKACSNYRSTSEFLNWQDVKSILLLFDSDEAEDNHDMRVAIEMIEQEGKKVTECMFVDKKKALRSSVESRVVVDRQGIDFMERPQGVAVRQLMENGCFDVVIDLSACRALLYVTMAVKARMKCGSACGNGVFDFQIEGEMDEVRLLEEIMRYLKMINK